MGDPLAMACRLTVTIGYGRQLPGDCYGLHWQGPLHTLTLLEALTSYHMLLAAQGHPVGVSHSSGVKPTGSNATRLTTPPVLLVWPTRQ